MDYNTLVERLLDGTITDAEKAELDRLMHSSPEIDREVRSLVEVEKFLRQKVEEDEVRSVAFRESVRSGLKVSLGISAAAATAQAPSAPLQTQLGTGVSSIASGASSTIISTIVAALVVAGAGLGYFLATSPNDSKLSPPPATAPVQQAPAQPPTAAVEPVQTETAEQVTPQHSAQTEQRAATREATVEQQPALGDDPTASKEVQGIVQESSDKNKRYSELIQQSLQRLATQEQTSRAAAAATAKQVALLYDKLGNTASARRYFDTARRYAQEASVREIEGEIAGEYALFESRNGNRATAENLAADALRTLRTAQSPKLPTWEAALKQLTR